MKYQLKDFHNYKKSCGCYECKSKPRKARNNFHIWNTRPTSKTKLCKCDICSYCFYW